MHLIVHTSDCITWLQQQAVTWCTCTLHVTDMLSIMLMFACSCCCQSVPEDSSATPSKAFLPGPALARGNDGDSTDGSPKIHVGRMASSTQSSMQLSNIMKLNQLFEQGSNGLAQEVHAPAAQPMGG